jgi:chondroitin AC lyase
MDSGKQLMRVKCLNLFIAAIICTAMTERVSAQSLSSLDADIAVIKSRLVAQYLSGTFADARRFLASQGSDGSWNDINYADRSLNWDPQKHLDRLKQMTIAYRSDKSPDHEGSKMREGITRGLAFWYQTKPSAENWWSNEIGQQLALEPILILMDRELQSTLLQAGSGYLHDPVELASYKFTGQNLVWCATEQFVRGVLRGSADDIATAVRFMESVDTVTADAEGIQYDHSFHQHGPQLYVGGYGLNFLRDGTTNARLVARTRFAYATDKIDVLSDYLLDGARLLVRGKMLDIGAIGREISRPGASQEALGLVPSLDNMDVLKPEKRTEYDALRAHIQGTGAPYSFVGHKHFWNSDFTVHQRATYYASVKMVSARTYGTETINGENPKGYWLPFGANVIARRGDEYLDVFPVWDWAHVPGVTSPEEVPRFLSHVDQQDTFVGGVSDGVYGAAAMKVDMEAGTSIHAQKAWFFFDDEYVALGAGISSTKAVPVSTTLNQSLQKGDVIVDGRATPPGQRAMRDISWVLHDGVGYVFPGKAAAVVSTGARIGSWSEINSLQQRPR